MTTDYRDLDREPARGDVEVRIGFPTIMGNPQAEKTQTVIIEVVDAPSRSRIIEISLSAEQFASMLGGSRAHVAGAWLPPVEVAARIGKTMQTDHALAMTDEGVAARVAEFMADGWETTEVRRTNVGSYKVIARRWVD